MASKSFKVIVVLTIISFASAKLPDNYKTVLQTCEQNATVNLESFLKNTTDVSQWPRVVKCLASCTLTGIGLMDNNTYKISSSYISKYIIRKALSQIYGNCTNGTVNSDPCEAAVDNIKCVHDQGLKRFPPILAPLLSIVFPQTTQNNGN